MTKITLKGLPASPGVCRGSAIVVRSWDEIDRVTNGAILVTRTSEPDMFPALFKVRGVVTDIGGVTSHAANNARELGLPCVVGTTNATQLIRDGDMVTVNGTIGEVVIEKN